MASKESSEDLERYYDHVCVCSECSLLYGSDYKEIGKKCPKCMMKGRKKKR